MSKITNWDKLMSDYHEYGRNVAKAYVEHGGELLQKRFNVLINRFYSEYHPVKYKRWYDLVDIDSLQYRNTGQGIIRTTLVLDSEEMVPRKDRDDAFSTSLAGIHGWIGINKINNIKTIDMIDDLTTLSQKYMRDASKYQSYCENIAQSHGYQILNFRR